MVGPTLRRAMHIGAHASIAGGVSNAVDEQLEYGGTCGQIFSHSPQVWRAPSVATEEAVAFRERTSEHDLGPWVIHASYLVNLSTPDQELRDRSIRSMQQELDVAATLGVEYVNVHLGAHTGAGVEQGITNAASALDHLDVPDGVAVLIESDAGAGTKLGGEFGHLATVMSRTDLDLGVCLDTAHMFAAGYDLSSPAAVAATLQLVDDAVGLSSVRCVHLNDSKHECGTHKDEHAHLGEGHIGEAGISALLTHDALRDRPFVLETPTEDGRSFAWNIEQARRLREP